MKTTTAWNTIFKDEGRVFHDPHEFMPRVAREMKKAKVKRILDLGCGTGRHLVYLAKKGFKMYGLDSSENAINMSREWLAEKNLHADFTIQHRFSQPGLAS